MRVFMMLSTRYGDCLDTYLVSIKMFHPIPCVNSFSIVSTSQSVLDMLSGIASKYVNLAKIVSEKPFWLHYIQ